MATVRLAQSGREFKPDILYSYDLAITVAGVETVLLDAILRRRAGAPGPPAENPLAAYEDEPAATTDADPRLPADAAHFPPGRRLDLTQRAAQLQHRWDQPPHLDRRVRRDLPDRVASSVHPHWVLLLPVRTVAASAQVRLARGSVLDAAARPRVVTSRARLLGDPDSPLLIPQEEVPRAGAVVRQGYSAARGPDGRLHVWRANRKSVGRGEGSSGLRFDTLEE